MKAFPRYASHFARRFFYVVIAISTIPLCAEDPRHVTDSTRLPALDQSESFAKIEVATPFAVQLVAAEPLVQDPVDFDWGPDGRLWIVEMADYPRSKDGVPSGRIRVLQDRDQDGNYDHATLFAENLNTPTGILVWRDGVLVTACPDILYLRDTDGDGVADKVEKLYSGFGEGNEQHRVNGLRWGLDNWVYLANGDSGGTIVSHQTGQKVDIRGRDVRIRPDTGEIQTQAGQTQFGRNCDDWGNWFGCNNPNPIFHYVLDESYLGRNPHLSAPPLRRDIRIGDALVYPIGPIISHCDPKYRPIGATPIFTSACGTIVYRDNLFGPEYQSATFTSEPVYNIVHARKLIPNGVSFDSVKLHQGDTEFFRSADPWSRPTGLHVGPDGALYIADMVREVIEHPEWIADELQQTLDLWAGSEMGRIYRVAPAGSERRHVPRLDQMTTAELVNSLDSPSGWQRDLVQRMLLWKSKPSADRAKDDDATALLRELLSSSDNPLARVHAIATLSGLGSVTDDDLRLTLGDSHPGVRRHGLRILAEQIAERDGRSQVSWAAAVTPLVDDSDSMVQLQLAYTLGQFQASWAAEALANVAEKTRNDPYLEAAVLSSVNAGNIEAITMKLLADHRPGSDRTASKMLPKVAAMAIKFEVPAAASALLQQLAASVDSQSGFDSLSMLNQIYNSLGGSSKELGRLLDADGLTSLDRLHAAANRVASANDTPADQRLTAIALLGWRGDQRLDDLELLTSFLSPQTAVEFQLAAANALTKSSSPEVSTLLLQGWKTHGPALRQRLLSAMLERTPWTRDLMVAIKDGTMSQNSLSDAQRNQLTRHRDDAIRNDALRLFAATNDDRAKVLRSFQSAVSLIDEGKGDATKGRILFANKCASCHRVDGIGHPIAPDLATLTNRSAEAVLTAIIDPNRAVEAKYQQYQLLLEDGRAFVGMLTEETATSVRLATADGKVMTLLRSEIERLQGSTLSMMPEGLEADLSVQQMADLIRFVIAPATTRK